MVVIHYALFLSMTYGNGHGLARKASTDGLKWINRFESEHVTMQEVLDTVVRSALSHLGILQLAIYITEVTEPFSYLQRRLSLLHGCRALRD